MELLITLARKIWNSPIFFVSLRVDGWEKNKDLAMLGLDSPAYETKEI